MACLTPSAHRSLPTRSTPVTRGGLAAVGLLITACTRDAADRHAPATVSDRGLWENTPSVASSPRGALDVTAATAKRDSLLPHTPSGPIPVAAGSVALEGGAVEVSAFAIDRTEVTTDLYARCVEAKACTPAALGHDCNFAAPAARRDHPVQCVTFEHAQREHVPCGRVTARSESWPSAYCGMPSRDKR
jgi:formylglycine-generating enzyme required for sulfatase activity